MAVTISGTSGITTPGVTNSAGETIATTLAVTGATTAGSLQVGGVATNIQPLVSGTSVATTSGTSIDFTSIPSWVTRITVMFKGVSTTGTAGSGFLIRLGSGGTIPTTGYASYTGVYDNSGGNATGSNTTGLAITLAVANSSTVNGHVTLTLLSNNTWIESHNFGGLDGSGNVIVRNGGGVSPALSGALDTVRLTTTGGTDTFDAGSINILYE